MEILFIQTFHYKGNKFMIEIDFEVDEEELNDNFESELDKLDYDLFVITMFIMPVRFKVDDIDVFEYKDDPWSTMPIINLASNGLLVVKRLKKSGKEEYSLIEGPGDFYFSMIDNENVKIKYE